MVAYLAVQQGLEPVICVFLSCNRGTMMPSYSRISPCVDSLSHKAQWSLYLQRIKDRNKSEE